jgi:hypothetical protein
MQWEQHQAELFSQIASDSGITLIGDGRCDSPGSSAKFCTYTLMDLGSNLVLNLETVDKREVQGKSPNMEREGLRRCLMRIQKETMVHEIATDASTSVAKVIG